MYPESLRQGYSPYSFNWTELQHQSMATSDTDSLGSTVGTAATLVDGTELTPQQLGKGKNEIHNNSGVPSMLVTFGFDWLLGLLGMEALKTVAAYGEDALVAYLPKKSWKSRAVKTVDNQIREPICSSP